jgi:hypothetical protein
MSAETSHQIHLIKSRELIVIADRLTQEYAELSEVSRVLRNESRQLSDDSYVLRRIGNRLLWDESR